MSGIQILKSLDWWTILIPDILDHKQDFFSPVFRPPFDNQTQIYHLNTRLVRYSDVTVLSCLGRFSKKSLKFLTENYIEKSSGNLEFCGISRIYISTFFGCCLSLSPIQFFGMLTCSILLLFFTKLFKKICAIH